MPSYIELEKNVMANINIEDIGQGKGQPLIYFCYAHTP